MLNVSLLLFLLFPDSFCVCMFVVVVGGGIDVLSLYVLWWYSITLYTQAFAVLHQAKPNVQLKANDENALRKPGNAKIEQKPSIDQYKVFNVLKVGDENAPPTIYMDETDHAVSNSSFSGIR